MSSGDVMFMTSEPTMQKASASFVAHIRQTLQRAQEVTQAVSEAETVADEAMKFCEAIKSQHNVSAKKFHLTAKPAAPVPPLAASMTREIQTSVVWTQTMLQMCTLAEGGAEVQNGAKLSFVKSTPNE
uniref:Uncharacterized protein n=1 Tax=Noctiluca scintillans TaxID=2966 RepID=A0A7S0ZTV2_NOCSC|mmetsp:Transcript_18300/g.49195  ORF Transcript_18300/g.49195 Transcript_18300/m.49195 type:complete len:128 (+) Transcript_18300:75-458(+)|eukprot:CAMPEP_0194504498 /NCGR_PEP_ID=MMETSP0253-20130528/28982_1 /TAXON_ID=2966 /ORGANISM="Noctiluca scintillans" /LENGTH=127 /DNA_ID=CAMNT_0039346897 /DNA_START=70 /DNA_END=453 /DNA_ORIENTATION=+